MYKCQRTSNLCFRRWFRKWVLYKLTSWKKYVLEEMRGFLVFNLYYFKCYDVRFWFILIFEIFFFHRYNFPIKKKIKKLESHTSLSIFSLSFLSIHEFFITRKKKKKKIIKNSMCGTPTTLFALRVHCGQYTKNTYYICICA